MGAIERVAELSKIIQSTGWDSNPRRRITNAESSPLDDQCLFRAVRPEGLEPSLILRTLKNRGAAANTGSIPCCNPCSLNRQWARTESNRRLALIRSRLSPLSYGPNREPGMLPLSEAGGIRTPTVQIKSLLCCRYTTTSVKGSRYLFQSLQPWYMSQSP